MLKVRIIRARLRRTLWDYRHIWRNPECSRARHLWRQWRASAGLVIVDAEKGKVYEVPFRGDEHEP